MAVLFLGDVERVVVEGRQCAHAGHQHRHRVSVTTEAAEEADHLLVQHGVVRDDIVEVGLLLGRGQFALQQQVADIQVVAVLGQILDGIAAIQQLALVAVDVGDGGFAGPGGHEAGVEGELAGVGVQLADVNDIRPHGSLVDRELGTGGTIRERQRCGVGRFGGCHCLPSKVISGQGPDHEGSRRTARRRLRLPAFAPSPNLSPYAQDAGDRGFPQRTGGFPQSARISVNSARISGVSRSSSGWLRSRIRSRSTGSVRSSS